MWRNMLNQHADLTLWMSYTAGQGLVRLRPCTTLDISFFLFFLKILLEILLTLETS